MGLLNRFIKRNKKTDIYQNKAREEKQESFNIRDDEIRIDIGDRHGRIGKQKDKTKYYEELRAEIKEEDKRYIASLTQISNSLNDVFMKMEEEGIPLDYLVALGLVEEVDIESYQNIKLKGLDMSDTILDEDLNHVDEDLKMELSSKKESIPELRNEITEEELYGLKEEDTRDLYQKKIDGLDKVQNESTNLIDDESDEGVIDKESFNKLKNLTEKFKKKKQKNITPKKAPFKRTIYVIAEGILIPKKIEGYNIVEVTKNSQLTEYTSSRKNLLVISQRIPKGLQKYLLRWLKGVSRGDKKYRIVTLKGYEVSHDLIETVISLDRESIDGYFNKYTDEKYEGKDVGSFLDITSFIE